MDYWESRAEELGDDRAIKELSSGFVSQPEFYNLYDGLSNREFVEAIYGNILGGVGDGFGVDYWVSLLDDGVSRSDMVADFVSLALDFDPESSQYSSLSQDEIDLALDRQAYLENKIDVSLYYIDTFGDETNLDSDTDPNSPASLRRDPAYNASVNIIADVTSDDSSPC